ncbi:hypothetical protein D8L93_05190 [Sodalis-like symbiont of Bactericera trigonica]|nr:hypothetical protein D8L93_05190 [Sodalis-like symbiont of Bactericera trigonica]
MYSFGGGIQLRQLSHHRPAVGGSAGGSALATFTAFMDLALGIVGPLAGMLMERAGAAVIYLAAALLVFTGLLMTLSLRRRQRRDAEEVKEPS